MIKGLSKQKSKNIRLLHSNKGRQKQNRYIGETAKLFEFVYQYANSLIEEIYCTEKWYLDHKASYDLTQFDVFIISLKELKTISLLKTPHDVLFTMSPVKSDFSNEDKLIILLDSIQDAGNLGTIIRTLSWFGINTLYCSKDSVDVYNPKVIQASMGAFVLVDVRYVDLSDMIADRPETTFFYTDMNGESIYSYPISTKENIGIVFGNEGKGVSSAIRKQIGKSISIPAMSLRKPESLNLSISVGIIISQLKGKL
jgi:TrmH family RNA methyltransferase